MIRRPANVAASVRARLLNRSRESGEDFQFLLQRYAAERFLHRLGESPHREAYVLKGAMLFAFWGGSIYRATRDLDFTGYGSSEADAVLGALREVCAVAVPDDGLLFAPGTLRAEPIRDDAEYDGLRIRLQAMLGQARIPLQIHIGFGNAIEPPAAEVEYPTLLGAPAPRIRAYPREAVVAEKLHAVVVLGDRNTRFKDFYDLYVLARQFTFEGGRLARALAATFERRRTAISRALPAALSPRFYADGARAEQWRAYLTRGALPGAPADFAAVGETLQAFLGPPWQALADRRAFSQDWPASGPWAASGATLPDVPSPRHASASQPARRAPAEPQAAEALGGFARAAQHERRGAGPRRYKPYPAYKDSGVEWLGEIPAHWEVKRLKLVVELNPSASEVRGMAGDTEVSFVPMEAVGEYGGIDLSRSKPLADVGAGYTYFRDGDVVVAKITPCFENGKGALAAGLTNGMAFGTTELHVFRATSTLDSRFLFYVTLGDAFRRLGEADMYGAGGQKRVSESFFRNLRQPLPSVPEQRAIAAFLDRETARIDALMAKKERLIELLQEKRTALITRAVTKGLDPTVPMKDSGVEWLGEIPAHWEVVRLKWAAQMVSGHTPDKKVESYWQGGDIPWVSLADTGQLRVVDYIATTAVMTTSNGIAHSSARVLPESTVVFSRDATIGLCAITRAGMAVSQHFIGWVCGSRLRPEYLLFVLRSMTQELERLTMGATVRTIGMPDVKSLVTPVPPLGEQEQIIREVLQTRARIDALIAKVREAIERLQELRTALISAAVTGKIDVPEEAA